MARSIPFRMVKNVPSDICEGDVITVEGNVKQKITKNKSVKFLDMRTMVIIGLCKDVD
ncbi:hypothetical protein [Ureibacillus sinduriensis]|uniref:hypothetical protein n=1 Tax=Ureibacillus sinduriensis TaxID=561440 RepID=UPI000ADE0BEA|nr:hypothetical protein [Ureibacillus sinduriensis]